MEELKKRILVVDDSESLRDFFQTVLDGAGYDVVTASSGEEGLEKTKALKPDLILLDFIMPGMDGLELLTRLRSDLAPPVPPVILCSGFDLSEEEALRRGALMFLRKPIAPEDLCEFVSLGLVGERVSAEVAARERANSTAARMAARESATTFVAQIRHDVEQRAVGQMAWLAGYFGLETAVAALMEDGRLTVIASSGDPLFATGINLAAKLSPTHEILESRSSLVLANASTHACFSTGPYRLEGIGFFGGVPLLAPEGTAIGVICLIDSRPRRFQAEDLLILEQVGRQGSLLLRLLSLGRPESELPGRLGAGMLLRPMLEMLIDAETRLLRQSGGSMALAIIETDEPDLIREAVTQARNRERLAAGAFGPTRVAVFKRSKDDDAAGEISKILSSADGKTHLRGVGETGVAGSQLPAIGGQDLVRLAELALDQAMQTGGGRQRLVLQHESSGIRDILTPA